MNGRPLGTEDLTTVAETKNSGSVSFLLPRSGYLRTCLGWIVFVRKCFLRTEKLVTLNVCNGAVHPVYLKCHHAFSEFLQFSRFLYEKYPPQARTAASTPRATQRSSECASTCSTSAWSSLLAGPISSTRTLTSSRSRCELSVCADDGSETSPVKLCTRIQPGGARCQA